MNTYPEEVWVKLLISLSRYIDTQVSCSGRHSAQVAEWVKSLARRLFLDEKEVNAVYWASLLHDIGKISIPGDVLSKEGPLSKDEWTLMRLHPTIGANIVKMLKSIEHIAPYINYHQEKYDGSGYPEGLRGEEIPFGARIVAVVDAYEAMTSDRYYCKARSHNEAIQELILMEGHHFDPDVVEAFVEIMTPVECY
ncbi:MAG: HD-GYP domain-containing protein [Anaerolineales bacterium]|nr:HD-GYP domain-containing protein [Anaerolineales bacterium]